MSRRAAADVLRVIVFAHSVIWIAWLGYAFTVAPSPPEKDWFTLREVGKSFIAGDWASLYADRPIVEGTMLFRYPLFVRQGRKGSVQCLDLRWGYACG